ncbi:MAG TPA: S41 family peptidase [Brevundimonas sp.]|nr:S41 family peptidase [Brevundimonas sp.]
MSLRLSIVFGCTAVLLLGGAGPIAPQTRAGWLADYRTLKSELENQYANLTWFASPEGGRDLPALDRNTTAALERATTEDEARTALLAFQAAFKDGHFVGRPVLAPASGESPEPEWPDLKAADEAARACLALGYGGAAVAFSLPIETLPGFALETDGDGTPFRSGIVTSGTTRVGVLRIPSFAMENFPALCRQSWNAEGVDQGGDVNQSALERAITKAWYAELAALLRSFETREVDAVLVDIGGNGGGDDSGDIATRLFSGRPLQSSPLLIKRGPAAESYLKEQLEQIDYGLSLKPDTAGTQLLSQARIQLESQPAASTDCDLSWVCREQRQWNPSGSCSDLVQIGTAGGPLATLAADAIPQPRIARRLSWSIDARDHWGAWTGPVYVLVDGRTASSAEMFAATLQNNGAAKVMGVPSAGAGCGAMGPDGSVVLAATQMVFNFPTCVRLRPDGSDEVAGLAPDILLRPTQGESRRARAARLFRTIEADRQEGSATSR